YAHASVGAARGHSRGDAEMSVFFARIPGDPGGVETTSVELVIGQHTRAGAALAVDVAQVGPSQVVDAGDPQGVAGRHHQPLIAVHQSDHGDVATVAEQPVDIWKRVLPRVRVEEVGPGDVTQPVTQGHQASKRTDVGRCQCDQRIGG